VAGNQHDRLQLNQLGYIAKKAGNAAVAVASGGVKIRQCALYGT